MSPDLIGEVRTLRQSAGYGIVTLDGMYFAGVDTGTDAISVVCYGGHNSDYSHQTPFVGEIGHPPTVAEAIGAGVSFLVAPPRGTDG